MARFELSALLAVFTLAHISQAAVFEECLRLAIEKGVPELHIPSHNPLVLKNDIKFHFDRLMGQEFNFVLKNVTWSNIPFYRIIERNVVNKTAEVKQREGKVQWDNFVINFNYDYKLGNDEKHGNIQLLFKNVVWSGEWEESTVNGTKKIDYITIKQVSATRQIKTTGWGLVTVIAESTILALYDIFAQVHINQLNLVGKTMANIINKNWYGNQTYFDEFTKWCNIQNL